MYFFSGINTWKLTIFTIKKCLCEVNKFFLVEI
jgi:hypothetical protein